MRKYFTIASLVIFLNACSYLPEIPDISSSISSFSEILTPAIYKKDIKQGSVIRKDKFNLLKLGMNQQEIIEIIGSPSIADPFHNQEWEYIHFSTLSNDEIMNYRLTLIFDKGLLAKINIINKENISIVEDYNIDLSTIKKTDTKRDDNIKPWYSFW